jgi:hypothetical protein
MGALRFGDDDRSRAHGAGVFTLLVLDVSDTPSTVVVARKP